MTMGRTINKSKPVHKGKDVKIKRQGHQSYLNTYERTRGKFQYVK